MSTENINILIKLPKVMRMTCRSKSIIYSDMKKNLFPKPIALGKRARAWKLHEVQSWIDEKCNKNEVA